MMESFNVDKFYDIESNVLNDFWDVEVDPNMTEVFKVTEEDWNPGGCAGMLEVKPQVVIHDRLMTDAVLGACNIPIKTEHSYCSSQPENIPDSGLDKIDDLEDECYRALPLNCVAKRRRSSSQDESPDSPIIVVKDEPMSDQEPDSPVSSCPSSPQSMHDYEEKPSANIMKQPATALLLATRANLLNQHGHRVSISGIKVETGSSGFSLPPTPPSSTSSDSEGNVSPDHPSSPASARPIYLTTHGTLHSTRQPIQTPLISCQPKGSTGLLILTDEEKRTLLAEGYPIPTKLPLTKAEEKSLKKIRRKIKNKISAQESRRKKKEYMDALEKKVEILSSENSEYKKRILSLEDSNTSLVSQLKQLQALIARHSPHLISSSITNHTRNSK